jgi:hypothetical protein
MEDCPAYLSRQTTKLMNSAPPNSCAGEWPVLLPNAVSKMADTAQSSAAMFSTPASSTSAAEQRPKLFQI